MTKRDYSHMETALRVLSSSDNGRVTLSHPETLEPLREMARTVFANETMLKHASLPQLGALVDRTSNLNLLRDADVGVALKRLQSDWQQLQKFDKQHKCLLSLWAACLWHGYSTDRFHKLATPLIGMPGLELQHMARLTWCVYNDPFTKLDPAMRARVDSLVRSQIHPFSLQDLARLCQNESREFSILRQIALELIAARVSTLKEGLSDNRIPSLLLAAWMNQRTIPADKEFFESIVSRCIEIKINPDLALEAIATFGLQSTIPEETIKNIIFKTNEWYPSVDQLASFALSLATIGLVDIECTSFIAKHLDQAIIQRNAAYHSDRHSFMNWWKVGTWYSTVLMKGSESTVAALHDGFRDLSSKIASGMWDNKGSFVRNTVKSKMSPTERAIRTVFAHSLGSLGIPTLSQVHIVNTPFVAGLFIPDKDTVISFVGDENILSNGEIVGQELLAKKLIEAKGYNVRLVRISEFERRHAQESEDEFLASVLKTVGPESSASA